MSETGEEDYFLPTIHTTWDKTEIPEGFIVIGEHDGIFFFVDFPTRHPREPQDSDEEYEKKGLAQLKEEAPYLFEDES